jgi:hypothetical protein
MLHKEVASLEPAEFKDMWDLAEKVLLSIALPIVVLFFCKRMNIIYLSYNGLKWRKTQWLSLKKAQHDRIENVAGSV